MIRGSGRWSNSPAARRAGRPRGAKRSRRVVKGILPTPGFRPPRASTQGFPRKSGLWGPRLQYQALLVHLVAWFCAPFLVRPVDTLSASSRHSTPVIGGRRPAAARKKPDRALARSPVGDCSACYVAETPTAPTRAAMSPVTNPRVAASMTSIACKPSF